MKRLALFSSLSLLVLLITAWIAWQSLEPVETPAVPTGEAIVIRSPRPTPTASPALGGSLAAPAYPAPTEGSRQPAPRVIWREPRSTQGGDRRPDFKLGFSRPMDWVSVAAALEVEPAVAFSLLSVDRTLSIQLEEPLAFGTTYHFTLHGTATDPQGLALAEDYDWSYRLKDPLARMGRPTLGAPDAPISLQSNYPLETQSPEQALQIAPAVPGRFARRSIDQPGRQKIPGPCRPGDFWGYRLMRIGFRDAGLAGWGSIPY